MHGQQNIKKDFFFLSVRLSISGRLPRYVHALFFKKVSALTYTNIPSNFHDLQYQYTSIVRNSGC